MKAWHQITGLSALLLLSGCAMLNSSEYSVACVNVGERPIFVPMFSINESSKNSYVGAGELQPGGRARSSPYHAIPSNKVMLAWEVLGSGKKVSQSVDVALPGHKNWAEHTSTIIFFIDPDRNRAFVGYEVFDTNTGISDAFDSSGRSIDAKNGRVN